MDIIKIPNKKEIKEFADKYTFAIKEVKNNVIELIDFDSFIISKEWKSLTENEKFIFLEKLMILNTTDNILKNHVISIIKKQKYSRLNYGDYEHLLKEYMTYKPINIKEFAEKHPFLIDKVENEIIYLNDFDTIINLKVWQNLTYEKQTEILRVLNSKIIDEAREKRYDESKKRYTEYHKLKYELPGTIINCNYLSEKWIDLDNDYGFFDVYILNDRPETKKEQIKHFKKELIRLYEINKTEHVGLIKKTIKELSLLGAYKEIKNAESRFKIENITNKKEKQIKLPIRSDIYNTVLKRKQTSLLAYFLRKNKLILRNTSYTLLADCFGKMTDYSSTQIEKDLKSMKSEPYNISSNINDYDVLIENLKKLITDIETYKQENEKIKNIK